VGGHGSGWQGERKTTVEEGLVLDIKVLVAIGALVPGVAMLHRAALRWSTLVVHLSGEENSDCKAVLAVGRHPVRQPEGARPHLPLLPAKWLEKTIRKVSASLGPATRR
jgi:hypothetical protein